MAGMTQNNIDSVLIQPRDHFLEIFEVGPPAALGTAEGLLLVGPETDLLHAQQRAGGRRFEREGDDAVQRVGRIVVCGIPGVGQGPARLDVEDLAIDMAPVAAELKPMTEVAAEVVDRKSTRLNSSH